ncbi:MAG TPA: hypothetical protein VFG69_13915, partial [Nannocystaceae bacterium]|nr:hypothetical protein [Nannocystaceae bacterium]
MFGFSSIVKKVFGTKFERQMKKLRPTIERINSLEDGLKALKDDQLRGKTAEFKQQLANGATLDDLLPEAF